ncbi:reverse transcriptase [Gossypium australe]|uniref:Reverse transcriptase n=1 Tax=Gossypium australe TaxID=47621 RepID=A0A5B6W8I7_9ROSI|nr:reverse transcriptase [Gossypium australe]
MPLKIGKDVTNIVLIPKIVQPTNLPNFRPIRLCIVLYNAIFKTVANCFQKVLECCIDKAQRAFVLNRLISDNVLIAYEILHAFKQKRRGRKETLALKIDMSKAYDCVEWSFPKDMVLTMGFASSWVEFLIHCLKTVTYSIVVNAKGLSTLMPEREGLIEGAKVSMSGLKISHLFADDSILFGEASKKGHMCFRVRNSVMHVLNVRNYTNLEKYLGLPNVIGRGKK